MTANSSQLRKYKEASKSPRGTPEESAAKAGTRKGKAALKSVDANSPSEARVDASVEAVEEVETPAPIGKNGRPTVRFGSAQSEARFNSKPGPNGFVRSEADRTELIKEYAPLIKFVAQKIAVRLPANIELDDLISSGVIGLMDAIDKYDPNRDNRFKTYAEFRIRGAILDELRSQDWVPRSVRDKAKLLDKTVAELEIELGRQATDEEVAERLNMTIEEFFELVNQVRPVSVLSIDEISSFSNVDKKSFMSLLEDVRVANPLIQLSSKSVKDVITKAIEELPERQRLVLSLYYYEDLNLKEIGKVLRVTESRVSQLHAQAMSRLRCKLASFMKEHSQEAS